MKHRSVSGKVVLLFILGILLVGCFNIPKKAPSWEADYQIPLTVTKTTAGEILGDDFLDDDGNSFFISKQEAGSSSVSVALDDMSSEYTIPFPKIVIGNVLDTPISETVMIPDVANGINETIGSYDFAGFEELGVKEGHLKLTIENTGDSAIDFAISLAFSNEVIDIDILGLGAGQKRELFHDLAGKNLSNRAEITIKNPQVESGIANLEISIDELNVDSLASLKGRSIDKTINLTQSFSFPQDMEYQVKRLALNDGTLTVSTEQIGGIETTVSEIKLDDGVLTKNQGMFSISGKELLENSRFDIAVNVKNNQSVTFVVPESIDVSVVIANLVIDTVILDSPKIDLRDGFSVEVPAIDLEPPFDSVRLDGATLSILLEQDMGDFNYDNLKVGITLKDNTTYNLNISRVDKVPLGDKLIFDSADVKRLINDVISGKVLSASFNGTLNGVGEISYKPDTQMNYTLDIFVPMKLEGDQTLDYSFDGELSYIQLDKDAQNILSKAIGNVKLIAEVDNGLPVGAEITITLVDVNQNTITSLTGTVEAAVNDVNGRPTESTKTNLVLELDKTKLDLILSSSSFALKPVVKITVPSSGAYFGPLDTVKIKALLVVRARIIK